MQKNVINSILLAVLSCMIWAGSFVIARGVHEFIPPLTLAFWRWTFALITIFPFTYKLLKAQFPILKKNWKFVTLMSIFGVAGFNSLVYIAAHYTSAHHIALISSISPIGTLLIAGILGFEVITKYKICGAVLAFFGAIIVIANGNLNSLLEQNWNKGDLLLLVSATIWAGWSAFLHYKPKELSSRVFLVTQMIIGLLVLLPFYLWENFNIAPTPFTTKAIACYAYLGIGSSCIAWLAWQSAINHLGAVKVSLIYYTIPIFSSILAVTLLHEKFELYHLLGFVFIFLGIITSYLNRKKSIEEIKNSQ